jgi:membrane protein DedA with SNARE-associated domain
MHTYLQVLVSWYLALLARGGLWGVVLLMAMESSIVPVPSELVVPPAVSMGRQAGVSGFTWAAAVALAGTLGSLLGASATYWVARWAGRPLLVRLGRYVLVSERHLRLGEAWVARYGAWGMFVARLLPGVRHVAPIPAGLARMPFGRFAIMTTAGAGLWCSILTVFGVMMADGMRALTGAGPDLLSPAYRQAFRELTVATVLLVAGGVIAQQWVSRWHRRSLLAPRPVAVARMETRQTTEGPSIVPAWRPRADSWEEAVIDWHEQVGPPPPGRPPGARRGNRNPPPTSIAAPGREDDER